MVGREWEKEHIRGACTRGPRRELAPPGPDRVTFLRLGTRSIAGSRSVLNLAWFRSAGTRSRTSSSSRTSRRASRRRAGPTESSSGGRRWGSSSSPAARSGWGRVRPDKAAPGETNIDPQAARDEGPPHDHSVGPFLISKYEMTQAQWLRFAGTNPSRYGAGNVCGGKPVTLLHPVEQVSHDEAAELLRHLGLRLPVEAEWEYAARAGTTTVHYTGNDKRTLEGAVNIADRYCKENSGSPSWKYEDWLDDGYTAHAPVGSFRANAFGLHDVLGNVWERCADVYDAKAYERYAHGDTTSPKSVQIQSHVIRGGSWGIDAADCRLAFRDRVAPSFRIGFLGVRPARVITE